MSPLQQCWCVCSCLVCQSEVLLINRKAYIGNIVSDDDAVAVLAVCVCCALY